MPERKVSAKLRPTRSFVLTFSIRYVLYVLVTRQG